MGRWDVPYLIYDPGTPNEKVYKLGFGSNTIGREWDNSIFVMDGSISRHHAEIAIGYNQVFITDLHSRNGTFVNELKIEHCELKDADWIRCGSIVFQFFEWISNEQSELPIQEDSTLSIVKQVSPAPSRTVIQTLLNEDGTNGSLIRLQRHDAEQRAVDKLKILLEVSKQLSSPDELDPLLEKILNLLFEIMKVDRGAILMVDEVTGNLECKAVKLQSNLSDDHHFFSRKIATLVCQKGEAILTTDACIDQRFSGSDSILGQAIHASMCVPLKPREEVIGVLYVDNLSLSNIYSDEDLEFLTALANQAAIAIDNSQLYIKMQKEAIIRDKLERFFPQTVSQKLREEGHWEIVETEVTALFADISEFTELSSRMAPRQVIELLNEYFKLMVEEIVFPYEGTLEKYIGDALLAIWGAPYQKNDDAERAVRAAIEMQWAVRRLNEEWANRRKLQISIHIGINTGKVAAGNIGSEKLIQYAAIGDTTNVTSRICGVAQAGEILISQSTLDKLGSWKLPLEKLVLVRVKGKDEPLQLYRVLWEQWP
jgi:adenylate cyclase